MRLIECTVRRQSWHKMLHNLVAQIRGQHIGALLVEINFCSHDVCGEAEIVMGCLKRDTVQFGQNHLNNVTGGLGIFIGESAERIFGYDGYGAVVFWNSNQCWRFVRRRWLWHRRVRKHLVVQVKIGRNR
ncbi:hypothetical protein ACS49_04380 [Bacillus cereus]|nr:hypothetical protein ACS49_04380 [Bacillus cereus]